MADRPKRHQRSNRALWSRIGLGLLALILAMALVASIASLVFYQRTTLPDPNKDFQTNTTFLYYNDGKTKLGSFAVQNRQTIDYKTMPDSIKQAAIAAENRSFWTDRGISPKGIIRSAWTIARGGEVQGGSTITQQYIKILYLTSDRTMTRKFRELALAVKLGREVSKEDILEGYLNTIYFGRGAYGIQAASRSYFNVDANKLTVPQAAVLASVLNNPSAMDPSAAKGNTARLLDRYRYVLDGMLQAGNITQAQHDSYAKALPKFPDIPLNQRWAGTRGYLLQMVQEELLSHGFTQSQVEGGGLQVTTTFDEKLQDKAVEVGQSYAKEVGSNAGGAKASKIHPTIASVKVGTGEVLAIYGGDDYIKNSRNWATTDRPAASTFKTYATIAGLRSGYSLYSTFNGNTFTPNGDGVPVRNEFSYQYGRVTLKKALQDSINTAFVDMTQSIDGGPAKVVKAANDAGIPKGAGWEENNRIALGMAEVSPLEQAGGYATIANGGVQVDNHVVAQVKDAKGKVVYTADTKGESQIREDITRDVTSALQSVVSDGTGGNARIGSYPVAGKTGTNGLTRNGEDIITSAWFVAYTKQISTAVMYVAGDDGNQALDPYKRSYDSTFFGGTYPALTWRDYMETAMDGLPVEQFDSAAGVNTGAYPAPAPVQTQQTDTSSQGSSDQTQSEQPSESASAQETTSGGASPSTATTRTAAAQTTTAAAPQTTTAQSTAAAPTSTEAAQPTRTATRATTRQAAATTQAAQPTSTGS